MAQGCAVVFDHITTPKNERGCGFSNRQCLILSLIWDKDLKLDQVDEKEF